MPKIKMRINRKKLFRFLLFAICLAVIIAVPIMASVNKKKANTVSDGITVLNVWQIDSFEGGKGSRAKYLQDVGDKFTKRSGCYVTVSALSADAARLNLKNGNVPDLISYGAGTYGIECYIRGDTPYRCWCNGGYCFLSLDTNANFEDVSVKNLIINGGTDNLSGATALLCSVNGAETAKPTSAYVRLINGEFKYLLGTQRDIFRLRTRDVAFAVKPVTAFNDLYQNISITCTNDKKAAYAEQFIEFLLENRKGIISLGLMAEGNSLYDDEMRLLEGLTYENRLKTPISEDMKNEINRAIINCDIKKLKNLLI